MRPILFAAIVLGFQVPSVSNGAQEKKEFRVERDLIVFVGKRLSVEARDAGPGSMDLKFDVRYKIVKLLHGAYEGDVIEFTVFDHYGRPPFAKFETVLLFVSRHEGKLYHEKYQFFDVYPTKEGRWATCGDPYKYETTVNRKSEIKPVKIEFATEIKDSNGKQCSEGNYVEDLFRLKKEGVLRNRGLFK